MLSYEITDEMVDHFNKRTLLHINNVRLYLEKMADYIGRDNDIVRVLEDEYHDHDSSKYELPEYLPYILITWRYKKRDEGDKTFDYDTETQNELTAATSHHIMSNKHHPDYWVSNKKDIKLINPNDRDKPTDVVLDCTDMPESYVLCMVADWLAMSREKNTNPMDWCNKNVGIRWNFSDNSTKLIVAAIDEFWDEGE